MSLVADLDSNGYRIVQLLTAGGTLAWCLACRAQGRNQTRSPAADAGDGNWTVLFSARPSSMPPMYSGASLAWR